MKELIERINELQEQAKVVKTGKNEMALVLDGDTDTSTIADRFKKGKAIGISKDGNRVRIERVSMLTGKSESFSIEIEQLKAIAKAL